MDTSTVTEPLHSPHPSAWCQNPVYTVTTCDGLCHRPWTQVLDNGLRLCWQHYRLRVVNP